MPSSSSHPQHASAHAHKRKGSCSSESPSSHDDRHPRHSSRSNSKRTSTSAMESPIATIETTVPEAYDGKGKLPPPPPAVSEVSIKTKTRSSSDRRSRHQQQQNKSPGSIASKSQYSNRTAATASTTGTLYSSSAATVATARTADSQLSSSSSKKLVRWKDLPTISAPTSNVSNETLPTPLEVEFDRISLDEDGLKGAGSSRNISHHASTRQKLPPPPPISKKTPAASSTSLQDLTPTPTTSLDHSSGKKHYSKRQRLKELKREMVRMEEQIQKAIRVELNYLDNAKEIRSKRDRLKDACQSLQEQINFESRHGQLSKAAETMLKGEIEKVELKIQKATRMESTYLKKSKHVHDKRYRWTKMYEHACQERQQLESGRPASPDAGTIASDRSGGSSGSGMKIPPLLPSTFVFPKSTSPSSSSSSSSSACREIQSLDL